MTTSAIENPRDRIATIMIAPFMSCSARLPVYTLMIAAFFPGNGSSRPKQLLSWTRRGTGEFPTARESKPAGRAVSDGLVVLACQGVSS